MYSDWRLLSSHGEVLFYLARNPDATIRQISAAVELSQRRVDVVVRDLQGAGMLSVTRVGRRNSYRVDPDATFRHPSLADVRLADVLRSFTPIDSRCA